MRRRFVDRTEKMIVLRWRVRRVRPLQLRESPGDDAAVAFGHDHHSALSAPGALSGTKFGARPNLA